MGSDDRMRPGRVTNVLQFKSTADRLAYIQRRDDEIDPREVLVGNALFQKLKRAQAETPYLAPDGDEA